MILEARKRIVEVLESTTTDYGIYYGQAEENAAFPYVIFNIDVLTHVDMVANCELEMNVIDYGRSTTRAEEICEEIIQAFDHKTTIGNGVAFNAYFERKNTVNAEDRKIVRRRLVFNFNLYERGTES